MQDTKYPLTPEEFKSIYSKVPRFCVEVIVETDEGIILTKRSIEPGIGQWHIPGGTVFFGESVEDAVRSVAKNELGIEVDIKGMIGVIEYPHLHKDGYFGWPFGLAILTRIKSGEIRGSEQGEEVKAFKEFPENTIKDQKIFLEKVLQGSCDDPDCEEDHDK